MYRTVETSFWTDPKVKALPIKAKLLFSYLITAPGSHISGIYYLPLATAAHEVGLEAKEVELIFLLLGEADLALYDGETSTIWVKNMLRHQARGQKILRAIEYQLASLHHSHLIKPFLEYYHELEIGYQYSIEGVSKGVGTYPYPYSSSLREDKDKEEKIRNKRGAVVLPDGLDMKIWGEFRKMRQRIRKPMTEHAEDLLLKDLAKLKADGHDPKAIVEQSIKRSWQGLFPVKRDESRPPLSKVDEIRQSTKETLNRGIVR